MKLVRVKTKDADFKKFIEDNLEKNFEKCSQDIKTSMKLLFSRIQAGKLDTEELYKALGACQYIINQNKVDIKFFKSYEDMISKEMEKQEKR